MESRGKISRDRWIDGEQRKRWIHRKVVIKIHRLRAEKRWTRDGDGDGEQRKELLEAHRRGEHETARKEENKRLFQSTAKVRVTEKRLARCFLAFVAPPTAPMVRFARCFLAFVASPTEPMVRESMKRRQSKGGTTTTRRRRKGTHRW
jgi:hypothetical protein